MATKMRGALRASVLVALLIGSMLVPANAAQASLGSCSGRYELHEFWALCNGSGSTHEFRAVVRCYRVGTDRYVVRYGVWRIAGHGVLSIASCRGGEEPASGSWQTRTR
jgi:hypothetical protein